MRIPSIIIIKTICQLSGSVSTVSNSQANDFFCIAGSRLGGDHISVGCGGPTLMLDNRYGLPEKPSDKCDRD